MTPHYYSEWCSGLKNIEIAVLLEILFQIACEEDPSSCNLWDRNLFMHNMVLCAQLHNLYENKPTRTWTTKKLNFEPTMAIEGGDIRIGVTIRRDLKTPYKVAKYSFDLKTWQGVNKK